VSYVNRALEVLEAIEECSVAQNIGQFARDFLASLLHDGTEEPQFDHSAFAAQELSFGSIPAFFYEYTSGFQLDDTNINCFEQGSQEYISR
jgi:hypothetical protein